MNRGIVHHRRAAIGGVEKSLRKVDVINSVVCLEFDMRLLCLFVRYLYGNVYRIYFGRRRFITKASHTEDRSSPPLLFFSQTFGEFRCCFVNKYAFSERKTI